MKRSRFTVMGVLGMLMFALVMGGAPAGALAKTSDPGGVAEPQAIVDTVVDTFKMWSCNTTPSHDKSYCKPTYKTISYRVRYDRTGPHFLRTESGVGECISGHRGTYRVYQYKYFPVN